MKIKVLYQENDVYSADEITISTNKDGCAIARRIGEAYEELGVEVLGIVRVAEIDVELL